MPISTDPPQPDNTYGLTAEERFPQISGMSWMLRLIWVAPCLADNPAFPAAFDLTRKAWAELHVYILVTDPTKTPLGTYTTMECTERLDGEWVAWASGLNIIIKNDWLQWPDVWDRLWLGELLTHEIYHTMGGYHTEDPDGVMWPANHAYMGWADSDISQWLSLYGAK